MNAADLTQALKVAQDRRRELEHEICELQAEYHALQDWVVRRYGQHTLDLFLAGVPFERLITRSATFN